MQHLKMRNILILGLILILFASFVSASDWCYQETANDSSVTSTNPTLADGSCSQVYNGSYSCTGIWADSKKCNLTYDGDWTSYGGGLAGNTAYMEINYTKPADVLSSSLWQVKDDTGVANVTIDSDCWDYDAGKLLFRIQTNDGAGYEYWQCYNSTDWQIIKSDVVGSSFMYEEAMWWDISSGTCTYTSGNWDITDDCTPGAATNVKGNSFSLASGYAFITAYDIYNMSQATIRGGTLTINGAKFEVGYN